MLLERTTYHQLVQLYFHSPDFKREMLYQSAISRTIVINSWECRENCTKFHSKLAVFKNTLKTYFHEGSCLLTFSFEFLIPKSMFQVQYDTEHVPIMF